MLNKLPLQFKCKECSSSIQFSVLQNQDISSLIECSKCHRKYQLSENITRKLKKFEALCTQIQESKEIFSEAAIAIDVGSQRVKMPFQLLLTRLSSVLALNIDGEVTTITFRVDTTQNETLTSLLTH